MENPPLPRWSVSLSLSSVEVIHPLFGFPNTHQNNTASLIHSSSPPQQSSSSLSLEEEEDEGSLVFMEGRSQEAVVMEVSPTSKGISPNPIAQLQTRFKDLETGFRTWLSKQSIPVEAAIVTATSGLQGAAIGGFMGTLTSDASSAFPPTPPAAPGLNPQALASLQQAQALSGGPLVQARNFAVMTGVNAGISCVMKRIRGKEDVQTSMVAAFGSGAAFSLVSGMGGPNQAANVITSGLFFALVQGGLFQLGQKFSQPPVEDTIYKRTRCLLTNLGLQKYEKNFKKGLLTDSTLPLLTDSALRDVRIPPGPRLLILDHIQRDSELKERR